MTYARAARAGAPDQRAATTSAAPTDRADPKDSALRPAADPDGARRATTTSIRRFIYELESAPEFVVIDDVTLAQSDPDGPLDADARAVDLLPDWGRMATERQRQLLLGALVVVLLAVALYRAWPSATSVGARPDV